MRSSLLLLALLAAQASPTLDAVSVRPSQITNPFDARFDMLPGRLVVRGADLETLAAVAHGLSWTSPFARRTLISGWPDGVARRRFDVEVTVRPVGTELSLEGWGPLVREVLERRFSWRSHAESRRMPVLALRMVRPGQLGPELAPRAEPCPPWPDRTCQGTSEDLPGGGRRVTRQGPLSDLLMVLQLDNPDRLVIDETGLEGEFDWELTSGPGPGAAQLLSVDRQRLPPSPHPERRDALKEQLGLLLEPDEAEVDVVVIDAVSLPEPN